MKIREQIWAQIGPVNLSELSKHDSDWQKAARGSHAPREATWGSCAWQTFGARDLQGYVALTEAHQTLVSPELQPVAGGSKQWTDSGGGVGDNQAEQDRSPFDANLNVTRDD